MIMKKRYSIRILRKKINRDLNTHQIYRICRCCLYSYIDEFPKYKRNAVKHIIKYDFCLQFEL